MSVLATLILTAGVIIAAVGLLGLFERLPRNRYFGVRTTATLRDAETFRLANKVAGLPNLVAGAVAIHAGIMGFLIPNTGGQLTNLIIGVVGLLGINFGAGVLGHRAAAALPEPEPAACKACDCGGMCFRKSVGADVAGVGGK